VAFGHMHSELQDGRARTMIHYESSRGTFMVNCAMCPRVQRVENASTHHFCVVDIHGAAVDRIRHMWVSVDDAGHTAVHHEQDMMRKTGDALELYDHHRAAWVPVAP
jgi:hypothetical protein